MKDRRTVDQIIEEIDAVLPPETPEAAQERRERIERARRHRIIQERTQES